jgi:hypothetical protein
MDINASKDIGGSKDIGTRVLGASLGKNDRSIPAKCQDNSYPLRHPAPEQVLDPKRGGRALFHPEWNCAIGDLPISAYLLSALSYAAPIGARKKSRRSKHRDNAWDRGGAVRRRGHHDKSKRFRTGRISLAGWRQPVADASRTMLANAAGYVGRMRLGRPGPPHVPIARWR